VWVQDMMHQAPADSRPKTWRQCLADAPTIEFACVCRVHLVECLHQGSHQHIPPLVPVMPIPCNTAPTPATKLLRCEGQELGCLGYLDEWVDLEGTCSHG
jgi:hypothetical protein